jgi:hypothetical protein
MHIRIYVHMYVRRYAHMYISVAYIHICARVYISYVCVFFFKLHTSSAAFDWLDAVVISISPSTSPPCSSLWYLLLLLLAIAAATAV